MREQRILYKIIVQGRVQGVGFRRACLREARFRGICGFVQNLPDGSVYIEAEGIPDQLTELVKWCQRGPGYGSVENLSVDACEPVGYNSFNVCYD